MSGDYFVYSLMTLNLGAAGFYAWEGQLIKTVYWVAVLVLNYCVLRMR